MRLRAGRLYALALPFKAAVGHSAAVRSCSDSVVVRLESESGAVGFGEAVARPYADGGNGTCLHGLHRPRALARQAGRPCHECGNASVSHKDGCDFCTACGYVGQCG